MSETQNTPLPCEQLLDYVYGELDETRRQAFETHLATCARCQGEAASFGRVRTAMRRMLPTVEPTEKLSGALHQQLIHQAAQRSQKSRRGGLLAFPRKLVEHPAWAAAAMFAIVGGALVVNWSHDRAMMPAAKSAPAPAAVPVPVAGTISPAVTSKGQSSPPPAPEPLAQEQADHATVAAADAPVKKKEAGAARDERDQPLTRHKPAVRAAASGKAADRLDGKDKGIPGIEPLAGGGLGGDGDSIGRGSFEDGAKGAEAASGGGYASSAPAPTSPPSPAAATPAAAGSRPFDDAYSLPSQSYRKKAGKLEPALQAPAGPSRDVEALRTRADELTRRGRCVEAVKAYAALARRSQYVSAQERANWARCLASVGDQKGAQQQLEQLKADKRASNAVLQKVEGELDSQAREEQMAAKKPANKAKAGPQAPAVDDAKTANQSRKAGEAPAQHQGSPPPPKASDSKPAL